MQRKKTIYIPIFSLSVIGKSFSIHNQNPGCGGTQFTSIKLAFFLAHAYSDYELVLINQQTIQLESPPNNLHQICAVSINDFLRSHCFDRHDYLIILTMAKLRDTSPDLVKYHSKRIIAWVHHPYNYDWAIKKKKLPAYVCVGTYQYYSNKHFYRPLWYIQNIFQIPENVMATPRFQIHDSQNEVKLAYIGALIPTKGFFDISKQWPRLRNTYPAAELHVIGSSATYGRETENELVPTNSSFAEDILQYIPEDDITNGKVVFYGNLGIEKFDVLNSCHAALLNPSGFSEAFPASPLECMSIGLPVIASDDYGMSDSMRFFPELSLKRPSQIPVKVKYLFSDAHRYNELRERALAVAKWFEMQNGQTVLRWRRLIEEVFSSNANNQDVGPILNQYGPRLRLVKRKTRAYLSAIKRYVKENKKA